MISRYFSIYPIKKPIISQNYIIYHENRSRSRCYHKELENAVSFSLVLLTSQFSLQDHRCDCWGGFITEQYSCMHFTDQQDHWSALTLEVEAEVFTWNDKHRNVFSVRNCVCASTCVRPWMESWCMIIYGCFLHPFMLKRSGRHHAGMANEYEK